MVDGLHKTCPTEDELVYGQNVNLSLLRLFSPGNRVLDIGCGVGAWGHVLRRMGVRELIGVEISENAAAEAEKRYDQVHRRPAENLDLQSLGDRPFDTIIAADVLEHMIDPWTQLARWRDWIGPSGQLVLSVPNLRYFRVLLRLAMRGRFDYDDAGGTMDRTHLRWFTRRSLEEELLIVGWLVRTWGTPVGDRSSKLSWLTGRRLDDLLVPQLQAVCVTRG
jgi:2-polyprenyl-3-methyl-5-hydroxy-6-metoxy-1,4-benzoquinol methylase